ncbi:MAG: amidohydrolase family protein [Deltaproteobacteria bacterium]|nr:amidohydrolase family protein [Deltaproteobacteria bacterium]MBT4642643.1 amidohydrolase family protein [Deltaproteobacteria bacterium]MBT6501306.1 amidohydrolase family protein [Deltaproteobacteria bacterium]MBT7151604.1 amidohydrolase family protein [Deltaproteobacteria bacterium]MBT7711894.1 amidohydrolase family protein [Deltaproteobacteria bacterium]
MDSTVPKTVFRNAAAIVTCDSRDSIRRDCDLLIEGEQIKAIGPNLEADGADIIDASHCFIYPGLVNTHHHFFQMFVRNLLSVDFPNMLVINWLWEIYEIFKRIDADCIYHSSLAAMADLLKHGCTTAFDHQYCFTSHAGLELVDRQFEAADQLGIRYHAGRGANTLPMSEGSTVPDEMCETTDVFLSDCERLINKFHDSEPFSMRQIVISPCQPINCRKETFVESLALAREKGVRLHTHLGEGENPNMVERWGMRTLEWCRDIDFVGEDIWYAHGWELTPEEYRVMAETRTGLSHCPAPAVLGGFNIIDMPAMKKSGMRLSLGVDGSATNDGSNLLDTLRMAFLMQSFHAKNRGGSPTPYEMLKIATSGGADILGRPDLGSLEAGKGADLFMIRTNKLEYVGAVHDPANLLARTGVTGPVDLTMVNGKVVFENGEFPGIDEEAMFAEAEKVCTSVIRQDNPAYDELKPV